MNENIKKFYDKKMEELDMAKAYMLSIFKTEERLELARKMFRTRYKIIYIDKEKYTGQTAFTSTQCMKLVFGDTINEETILRLKFYDCLIEHIETIREYLNNETAVLVREPYSIGEDDYDLIVIASLTKFVDGYDKSYWALWDEWHGECYGDEVELSAEKEEKVLNYWRVNRYEV